MPSPRFLAAQAESSGALRPAPVHAVLAWLIGHLLALPRWTKRLVAFVADALLCGITLWLVLSLRLEAWVTFDRMQWAAYGVSVALALPLFVRFGLYRAIFRYSGMNAMLGIVKAMSIYTFIYLMVFTVVGVDGLPRSVGLFQPLLLLLAVAGVRMAARNVLGDFYSSLYGAHKRTGVLIYGAGAAGQQLAAALAGSNESRVHGFLDDNVRLHGQMLDGRRVYNPAELGGLIKSLQVKDVLLALPSIGRAQRNAILTSLRPFPVRVRTLPGVSDLATGRVTIKDLHDLGADDLLGRDAVDPDDVLLSHNIRGKVVLVTGAGGSIGSELCRIILQGIPRTLLLVEISEFGLYQIHQELSRMQGDQSLGYVGLIPLLASVQDPVRMNDIMATWKPDTVYHAAAYKHVPIVEHNPAVGIRNNAFGTLVCARAALAHHVEQFVLISTDKAVRLTNVMGATKRLAENVLQALAAHAASAPPDGRRTCFAMVRFGNVLDSSGSVVPLFRQQINQGGPVTLTHPDVTRFFMTIREAGQLVIQAGAMAQGGDVFVLDMGEPMRIADLARRMIELSGLKVRDDSNRDGDIAIEIVGLRPGEKLYEELLIGNDPQPTRHPRIMKALEHHIPWAVLEQKLFNMSDALDANDVQEVHALLTELIDDYRPANGVVDWGYLARAEQQAGQSLVSA